MTVMRPRTFLLNLALGLGAVAVLLPFVWMLSLSVKPESEIYSPVVRLLPQHWDWANYAEAFAVGEVGTLILNGWIVTTAIVALQFLTVIPAAYVLAREDFVLKGTCFALVLAVLLIPPQVTAIPVYLMLGQAGLLNTRAALILPFATSAFGLFLMRQSFRTVPQSLIDAARMDGAGEFRILWSIVVPQVYPALAAFAVFSVVAHWNDFFWPLIAVTDLDKATPPLGIAMFASEEGGNDVGPMMASATLIVMPLIAAFLLARKRFVEGISMTGLGG